MKLNLKKPIAFFDIEATGLSVTKDRIVEISVLISTGPRFRYDLRVLLLQIPYFWTKFALSSRGVNKRCVK